MSKPNMITIPVKALTPIWTGDANRQTSYIKGTSLLGGLRLWTEALMRTLGKRACNITGQQPCLYSKDSPVVCDVCNFFGCTGKGRSFALKLSVTTGLERTNIGRIEIDECAYEKNGQTINPTWPLTGNGLKGNFSLHLSPLRPGGIRPELALALVLMLQWGTLGAKDQFGYGVISTEIPAELKQLAQKALPTAANAATQGLSLRDFFFFQADNTPSNPKIPYKIRCKVRQSLRDPDDQLNLRHYFCGFMARGGSIATKYNMGWVSAGNTGQLTGWGYFPREGIKFSSDRDNCLNLLKDQIEFYATRPNQNPQLKWREFDSNRDTGSRISDVRQYLENLLEGDWA